ncbi:MAG: hypothetical protein V4674_03890, partial [Patescibacteria group bacterium]
RRGHSDIRIFSNPGHEQIVEVHLRLSRVAGIVTSTIKQYPANEEFFVETLTRIELAHAALSGKIESILCAAEVRLLEGHWEEIAPSSCWVIHQLSVLYGWLYLQAVAAPHLMIVASRLSAAIWRLNKERARVTGEFIG